MAEIGNKTLWMRPVEWSIILKLLKIIHQENGKLHPFDLEKKAIENNVFISKITGKALAHSPRFYYRKVLEHLGLAYQHSGRYYISDSPVIRDLFSNGTDIDSQKKQIIADLIVNNEDCRQNFISLFALEESFDLKELQKKSTYIIAKSYSSEPRETMAKRKLKPIALTSPLKNKKIFIDTPDRTQAIFWGIRRWLLDLDVIDEIITSMERGRIIYIINPNVDNEELLESFNLFLKRHFLWNNEWATIYVPDFYEHVIFQDKVRASVSSIRQFIINFINNNKASIIPIPISGTMLNTKIKFEKQDTVFKRAFLSFQNLGYVAHLHVHKTLIQRRFS